MPFGMQHLALCSVPKSIRARSDTATPSLADRRHPQYDNHWQLWLAEGRLFGSAAVITFSKAPLTEIVNKSVTVLYFFINGPENGDLGNDASAG